MTREIPDDEEEGMVLLNIRHGHLEEENPKHGQPVHCFLCGTLHKADGIAILTLPSAPDDHVALCEPCRDAPGLSNLVIQKYLLERVPDHVITEAHRRNRAAYRAARRAARRQMKKRAH